MCKKKNVLVLVLFMIFFINLSSISASDILTNDSVINEDLVNSQRIISDSYDEIDSLEYNYDSHLKSDVNITHVINKDTYTNYFTENGTLSDDVNDGDILDFQGNITLNNQMFIIDKSVNITSTTNDSFINLNSSSGSSYMGETEGYHFRITSGGSNSNLTNLNFFNTLIITDNATNVVFDNLTVVTDNGNLGMGIGLLSLRYFSTNITIKNSYVARLRENDTVSMNGGSVIVLALASNCLITNNTIVATGNAGNLIYLTTYNVYSNGKDFLITENDTVNSFNTISYNKIYGPKVYQSMCWGIVLTGHGNIIENNYLEYNDGVALVQQWGNINEYSKCYNTTVRNNVFMNNSEVASLDSLLFYNNTVNGTVSTSVNSQYFNNTVKTMNVYANVTVYNNTADLIYIRSPSSRPINNVTIVNNTVKNIESEFYLSRYKTLANSTIKDNIISDDIKVSGNVLNIVNNTIITNSSYTMNFTTLSNSIISNNYLLTPTKGGNDTIFIKSGSGNILSNNIPYTANIEFIGNLSNKYSKEINITVNVTDGQENPINEGNVTFIIDNQTIGNVNVSNGIAILKYTIPSSYKPLNVTAVYACENYMAVEANSEIIVYIYEANVTVLTSKYSYKPQDTITITAIVSSEGKLLNGGKIVFKLNGLTLKENSTPIIVNVENGYATVKYLLPGLSRDQYEITAVYSNNFYNRAEGYGILRITKSLTQIRAKAITNGLTTTITGNILDSDNNNVNGRTVITIKINGLTFVKEANVYDGIINEVLDTSYLSKNTFYNLTIIAGENRLYQSSIYNTIFSLNSSKINKIKTSINISHISDIDNNAVLIGFIEDLNNNLINTTGKISVTTNGITITQAQLEDGLINISFSSYEFQESRYNLVILFSGNDVYASSQTNATLIKEF